MNRMRLIDSEMIKIPTSMVHSINGCLMIRVEDVQRIVSDQPTAFDKEKVIEELTAGKFITIGGNTVGESVNIRIDRAVEIVEKGGIK